MEKINIVYNTGDLRNKINELVDNTSNLHDEINELVDNANYGVISIANGGTGATNAEQACINLGIRNSDGHLILPSGIELY